MKLWLCLTLVCAACVGLLLGLTPVVGLNYPLQVLGSGSWFNPRTGLASTVSFIRSMEFDPAGAGPLESLVFDCVLTADNIGPPGQETCGRPELIGPWKVAGQADNSNQRHRAPFSAKLLVQPTEFEESGFCNSL
jgi:hypothetical protein